MKKSLWLLLGMLGIFPAVGMADRLDLTLAWPGRGASQTLPQQNSSPTVLSATRSSAALDARSEPDSEQQLVVVGLDAQGNERYRQVVDDPTQVRAEIFDPVTGEFEASHAITQEADQLDLALPVDAAVRRLAIYRPHFDNQGYTLELLAEMDSPPVPDNAPDNARSLQLAAATGAATVIDNGDPASRVDMVFLGDGYTAAEMGKYAQDVNNVVSQYFSVEPYASYAKFFNVRRLDIVSNESGVDHPERGILRNTALDATYNCSGIQRLICASTSKARNAAAAALPANARDIVLVIVNDSEYGGSGGSIGVISTHPSTVYLALHELGHTFGRLADEYAGNPPPCSHAEPSEANSTTIVDRATTKWAQWIDASTPLPTSFTYGSHPGLYLGSRYCDSGMYRPTDNSMMRTLGVPFFAVNEEALIKRMYVFARPIDAYSPAADEAALTRKQNRIFSITTPPTLGNTIEVSWFLNGVQVGSGGSYNLFAKPLHKGTYTLTAIVHDSTSKVRSDPNKLLTQTRQWTVNVSNGGCGKKFDSSDDAIKDSCP